jgi:hypothetical protein
MSFVLWNRYVTESEKYLYTFTGLEIATAVFLKFQVFWDVRVFRWTRSPRRSSEDDGITITASSGNTWPKTQLQIAEGLSLLLLLSLGFMQHYNLDVTEEE